MKRLYERSPDAVSFEAPVGVFTEANLSEVLKAHLEEFPEASISTETDDTRIPLSMWANEIFRATRNNVGEFRFRKLVQSFEEAAQPRFATLDSLRLFPGSLRLEKDLPEGLSSLAALELARVTVLFSPQSDEAGSGEFLIANPTLEILESKFEKASELVAVARRDAKLIERAVDWQDAAVFDELRENPKLLKSALIDHLESESYSLSKLRDFADVVETLIRERYLLRRGS